MLLFEVCASCHQKTELHVCNLDSPPVHLLSSPYTVSRVAGCRSHGTFHSKHSDLLACRHQVEGYQVGTHSSVIHILNRNNSVSLVGAGSVSPRLSSFRTTEFSHSTLCPYHIFSFFLVFTITIFTSSTLPVFNAHVVFSLRQYLYLAVQA